MAGDFSHAARAQGVASWTRRRGATDYAVGEADCAPIPVVLLPGILERSTYLAPLGRYLAERGHPVQVVDSLGWNTAGLRESVRRCLKVLREREVHEAVFVAHSKGGLIGKALLMDPQLGDAAVGLVALASPFVGSTLGGPLQRLRLVSRSPLGLFNPTSRELEALSRGRDVNARIVSLAPEWDQMIPGGSHLDGATNVTLENRGHFRLVDDPAVWDQVHSHIHRLAEQSGTSST